MARITIKTLTQPVTAFGKTSINACKFKFISKSSYYFKNILRISPPAITDAI